MFIKIINQKPEVYSIQQLQSDNPQVSFPQDFNDLVLMDYQVYRVKTTIKPTFNYGVENIFESFVLNENNEWEQKWIISPASEQEIKDRETDRIQKRTINRINSYQQESDPIFFKFQRGKATAEEWLSKISEIKARYI